MTDSRYQRTQALYERAKRVVPAGIYGHQNPMSLVPGEYPYFFERGEGSHVWDVDGNEYIDYMCSYGPIVLGHNHPAVESAAAAQRRKGNCFNGPTALWVELAEHLVGITPFADWAAFAKNGSDVCTWAVEIARHHTGRRKVLKAKGAYHGTHAWCTPLAAGTTAEDVAHVVPFRYNDLPSLQAAVAAHGDDVAAVIVTPFKHETFRDQELPVEGFLPGVRKLCDDEGIIFILDDVRAGFRLHLGGSCELFGVKPDLSCYCKAIANGYPLAACLGRESLREAAAEVFFTGSYFTSGVPMAASLACLKEIAASGAIEKMAHLGTLLRRGLEDQGKAHGTPVRVSGPPAIPFMSFADDAKFARARRFAAACSGRGVYIHPTHNWFLSAAHSEEDIRRTLDVTDAAFAQIGTEA